MIRVSISIPLSSLPGVVVESEYVAEYQYSEVDLDTSKLALVFEGHLLPDYDYESEHDFDRTRPFAPNRVKLGKPRLEVLAGD